jgi:ubiquinone/menaquinone biosynthesis C-methylase UbiE
MVFFNYSTIIDPFLRDIRIFISKFSGIKPGSNVLDVCCGTGDQVFYWAEEGMDAFGADFNPNMIRLAQNDKRNKGAKNVFFRIGDATKLPFEDGFFDCVSISLALHEMEKSVRDKVVSEMKRVVKKKGKLIFTDFQVPFSQKLYGYIINAIEYLLGHSSYEFFKDYVKRGGLPAILKESRMEIEEISFLKNGNIAIIKVKPQSSRF